MSLYFAEVIYRSSMLFQYRCLVCNCQNLIPICEPNPITCYFFFFSCYSSVSHFSSKFFFLSLSVCRILQEPRESGYDMTLVGPPLPGRLVYVHDMTRVGPPPGRLAYADDMTRVGPYPGAAHLYA